MTRGAAAHLGELVRAARLSKWPDVPLAQGPQGSRCAIGISTCFPENPGHAGSIPALSTRHKYFTERALCVPDGSPQLQVLVAATARLPSDAHTGGT
jgi:hypothetical protein